MWNALLSPATLQSMPPVTRPTPLANTAYITAIENLDTEAELEQERADVITKLLDSFVAGVRFFAIRVTIKNKHARMLKDESFDKATAFDADRLIAQLRDKCMEHEVSSGVTEAERRVASDAALEYPPDIGGLLGQTVTVGITSGARARLEQKLLAEGVPAAHLDRYREIVALMAAAPPSVPPEAPHFMSASASSPPPPALPPPAPPPAPPQQAAHPYPTVPPSAELPFVVRADGIELQEGDGNAFHLAVVLRKYTSAKMSVTRGSRVTTVENRLLWDALGLLRSLRYDVQLFNSAVGASEGGGPRSRAEVRYLCYRLMRQASSFGVKLPKAGVGVVGVAGLGELIAHIEAGVSEHMAQLAIARETVASGLVDFASLAELFTPGADLVDHGAATGLYGVPTAVRIRACYYSRGKSLFGVVSTFFAACEFAVSVGDRYAIIESHQAIPEFQGTRSTREGLENWLVLTDELKHQLARRGRLYCNVATGHSFVEHGPSAFLPAPKVATGSAGGGGSSVSKARSTGRMMVDVSAAWDRGVHCARTSGEACEAVVGTLKLVSQRRRASGAVRTMEHYGTDGNSSGGTDEDGSLEMLLLADLPPSLLWRTWPVVAGFSFAAKAWGVALVDGLRDASFNDRAFEQLVLPASRKRLIEALVLSHSDAGRETADLISGKGEGSIFLLHGPPGVGKTLTAEAIAELLHKPLYTVSMGELGTTPESLEANLTDVLALCVPWGALVLIDEAEMLLERRTKSEIHRNAMVCVMLRLLEYYQGVLFLTSNRVEALDPAFQSRVQCALRYDALDVAARRQIWSNLLAARRVSHHGGRLTGGMAVTADASIDVDALAAQELNGRQIKNSLQLALALARRDGAPLSQSHLDATLELSTAFAQATSGASATDGAAAEGEAAGQQTKWDEKVPACFSLILKTLGCQKPAIK